jgi:hypothetical protein
MVVDSLRRVSLPDAALTKAAFMLSSSSGSRLHSG